MSGIVVITTKGEAKRNFTNLLQKETDGAIKLVVLQNFKHKDFIKRFKTFYRKVGLKGIVMEIYHFLAVKLSKKKKNALSLISTRSKLVGEPGFLPEVMETNNVNADDVYERVKEIDPSLVVIWGGSILKQRLIETAPMALNLHFGFVPYYRGVNGIEQAILNDDLNHIGVTIHRVVPEVDAGEVIKIIAPDHKRSPQEFFRALNDQATKEYLKVVKEVYNKGKIDSRPQDLTRGKNHLLKEWTYQKQDALVKKIINWQKKYDS